MKIAWVVLALVVVVVAALAVSLWPARPTPGGGPGQQLVDPEKGVAIAMSSATESAERAARLLPSKGSEDRRDLLAQPAAPRGAAPAQQPQTSFTIAARAKAGQSFELAALRSLFSADWLATHNDPEVRVRGSKNQPYFDLMANDTPATFTEIQFEWPLVGMLAEKMPPLAEATLAGLKNEVTQKLEPLAQSIEGGNLPAAAARARELRQLQEACDRDAIIVLAAPPGQPFDGRKIWDVMLSLGLEWGDFDLFNWVNTTRNGDDWYFSVSTSTAPGYFLPEEIAKNQFAANDLIFSFTIPRSSQPQAVYTAMARAADYSQSRLGGQLLDQQGQPLNRDKAQTEIAAIEKQLRAAALTPGSYQGVPFGSRSVRVEMYTTMRQNARVMMRSPGPGGA